MISKFRPSNLGQKTALYVLIPTLFILIGSGLLTMRVAKEALLEQWVGRTNSILQSAAGGIDNQLRLPKELLQLIQQSPPSSNGELTRQYLLHQMETIPGVTEVTYEWPDEMTLFTRKSGRRSLEDAQVHYKDHRPYYTAHNLDAPLEEQYIVLHADFLDKDMNITGWVDVKISFEQLIGDISKSSWWSLAFMLNPDGKTFAYDRNMKKDRLVERHILGQMQSTAFGTILGDGLPPKEVCVFYNLNEAPWTLVVVGTGTTLMKPLIKFRNILLGISLVATIIILLTIYIVTSSINKGISKVSTAARKLTKGEFGADIPVTSRDEIGSLCEDFNKMTSYLKEGLELQKSMEIAREVQQNLLPKSQYSFGHIDIAGKCIYCDATGGDFYDVIPCNDKKQVSVLVGDVVGHGIGAALLMATTRALLRSKLGCNNDIGPIMTEVNSLLCRDTVRVNNFVTLFLVRIDFTQRKMKWVRAGHESSLAYIPKTKTFQQLVGKGLPLGIETDFQYGEQIFTFPKEETILLLATDGIYESQNKEGEQFGRQRVEDILAQSAHLPANDIVNAISTGIRDFLGKQAQEDDITLMIIKVAEEK